MPSVVEAFEALKQYMITNFNAKVVSGGREILKRCHFCGDSRNLSDAHLYIGIKNGAICYNCFKCNSGGIVDGKFLRELGCYDTGIVSLCHELSSKFHSSKSSKYGMMNSRTNQKALQVPISNNEYALKKLNYLSNRLGCVFNEYDVARFKIVLNLKDFLHVNNITKYTRNEELVDLIDKFFIGFLSVDNSYVILRRLIPEGKLPEYIDHRYVNYNIFGGQEGEKFYIIPNGINTSMPIDIHVAEGAFDILSIYLNVAAIGSNGIFGAVNGKSYASLIRHLITNYGFMGFNLHLYPDEDVGSDKMSIIKKDVLPFCIAVYVHRNTFPGEKDYGVCMKKINDTIIKI